MQEPGGEFTADRRIAVYQNNYHQGLISALETSYPNCRKTVGDQYFGQLAGHYITAHPPQEADLNQYGSSFPSFIREMQEQRPELSGMAYLSDLAALDWLLYQVYFSPDRKTWPAAQFQELTAEQQAEVSLCLSPDVYYLSSDWPLYELWQLNRDEAESVDLDAVTQREFLVLYRDTYQAAIEPVSEHEFKMLAAIQEGQTIITLTQQFPEYMDRLAIWIQRGWLCDFQFLRHDV